MPTIANPTATDPILKPWDRQPKEPLRAWAAFVLYRDQGPERTLLKAYQARKRSRQGSAGGQETAAAGPTAGRQKTPDPPGQWGRWSRLWGWVDRCRAYDADQDRIAQEAKRAAVEQSYRDMLARHAQYGQLVAARGAEKLADMGPDDIAKIGPTQAAQMVLIGTKVERTSVVPPPPAPGAAAPTDPVGEAVRTAVRQATAEELENLDALLTRVLTGDTTDEPAPAPAEPTGGG